MDGAVLRDSCMTRNNMCNYDDEYFRSRESGEKLPLDEVTEPKRVVESILEEIFDTATFSDDKNSTNVFNECDNIMLRAENVSCDVTSEECRQISRKASNRKTRVFCENHSESNGQDENKDEKVLTRQDSLYSLREDVEELPRSKNPPKKRNLRVKISEDVPVRNRSLKSSIFGAVFRKRSTKIDHDDESPPPTNNTPLQDHNTENRQRTSEKSHGISRVPSFRKKLTNFIQQDAPSILKRSFSFKDLTKRRQKEKSRERLSEVKNLEWANSLQSLVESDIGISYKDLSFIDYDVQNQLSYSRKDQRKRHAHSVNGGSLQRTQSLYENNTSLISRKPNLSRGTSYSRDYQSSLDLSNCGALSLPSLNYLPEENGDISSEELKRSHKYRRRPPSICSEDGSLKSRPLGNGSFKNSGNCCAKLRRHNACRQKSRDSALPNNCDEAIKGASSVEEDVEGVRSKSLNHLDEIEMRQCTESSSDSGLKDSKSEPDCAKTLLAPPARAIPTPEPTFSTPSADPIIDRPTKRHVLTRSQKSSSECFSVNFEVGDESTWDNELFFPAARGITLNDSITKLCELRNIDLGICDAWLQDKSSNNNTWIHFTQDTACLVGKHVRITAKDVTSNKKHLGSSFGNHSRKPSTSTSRSRTSSFFSSSTEDASGTNFDGRLSFQEADFSKKQPKQRWSGFFSNTKDAKMELLVDQLNTYAKNGIPNSQVYPQGQCESIDALYKLEVDWKEIIDHTNMPEKLQQQQTALWELIKTEVAYIKTLKVVTDLFLACLENLQSVNLLKEIDTGKLFSNIKEILDANVLFWRNCIFPLVRDMRRFKQPPCIENMSQGFLKISETFQAYFRYCGEQARCQHYCRENHTHNELFTAYLAWCETQKECNRLRLMDILVQPMQRLTKYGLLLKAILRNTDDDVERDNLNLMIKSVDDFVNNVNLSLKQKQDNERLKGIMARIESYDAVESKDDDLEKLLKSYSQLDLNRPMIGCPSERKRHLLLEGDLKLKDSSTSKMEVHCFLLTDMLLVCKPSTKKGGATMRIIRQPYLVDRLVITELTRETPSLAVIYKNEFDLPIAAFILQNNDIKKLKSWKESIFKAQSLYSQAKQMKYVAEESVETDYTAEYNLEADFPSLHLIPRSPLASSSRASRVSSLAHSHSGSVEMNDQSSVGSINHSRAVSVENENRTASISSDEGVQPLPADKSPVSQKLSFKHRLFNKTPNTLSVQPFGNLGQSMPNLSLGSPNVGTLSLNLSQNTLLVPSTKNGSHLLSPTHRGVSYPPPSPTRGNLKRGLAISQSKNPPLLKTRHITSTAGCSTASGQIPTSFDFDVPVIAGISGEDCCETFSRGQHRQAMLKRIRNDNKRYHTAGAVDDIKHNDKKDPSIHKRLSWNCSSQGTPQETEPGDLNVT